MNRKPKHWEIKVHIKASEMRWLEWNVLIEASLLPRAFLHYTCADQEDDEAEREKQMERGRSWCRETWLTRYSVCRKQMKGWLCVLGRLSLFCRCYQVKPPTTDCHHGDTMVTTRCSTRKERDLYTWRGFVLYVSCPHFYFVLKIKRTASGWNDFPLASSLEHSKFLFCMNAAQLAAPG